METILKKAGIDCYHKVFSQTFRKEESQDSVVPDTVPDIAEILDTSGSLLIRSKEVSAGHVRLEALILSKVVFIPEGEGGLRCLDVSIPVYIGCDDESISNGSVCTAALSLVGIDARMLNPRKVMVRAEVNTNITCWDKSGLYLPCGAEESGGGINTLIRNETVTAVECVTEKTFAVTDEYALPTSKPPIDSILSQRSDIVTEEIKNLDGRIILRGSVKSSLLYSTADGQAASLDFSSGFSQMIEAGEAEESFVKIDAMLTGAYYEVLPDSGGRTVGMELHLVAQAVQTVKHQVEYIADAYCNSRHLELTEAGLELECVRREVMLSDTIRDTLELRDGITELCDAYARCGIPAIDGAKVAVPVTVRVLYKSGDGKLKSTGKRCDIVLESPVEEDEMICGCLTEPVGVYAVMAAGGVELRISVSARVTVCRAVPVRYISDIAVSEEKTDVSDLPSLTLLKARGPEELWSIAKENCSTIEAIEEANDIDERFQWGRYILVPKTV